MDLLETFGTETPVIGMIHLRPLPGSPQYNSSRSQILQRAKRDLDSLIEGGIDGIMIENLGDIPYYPESVPNHTVASMTHIGTRLAQESSVPMGINVLRNDGPAAMSIASAINADYIRINVHLSTRRTDQGIIEGEAHETMRLREQLDSDVDVFTDVDVKHSVPLGSERPLSQLVEEHIQRGMADGIIVSGETTGSGVDIETLTRVVESRDAVDPSVPVFVGSGVTPDTIDQLLTHANGVIVGTAIKEGKQTENPVSPKAVKTLCNSAHE
ncbi:MAG: BtpA/SgcQ family protein [Halobacteriaceae archaeon]